jgi:hypothetical protein
MMERSRKISSGPGSQKIKRVGDRYGKMEKYCSRVPGSSVGIATRYGLNGPGIKSRWVRDFLHLSRPVLGPPSLLYKGYWVFPEGKERPGRDADPSPPSSTVVIKE